MFAIRVGAVLWFGLPKWEWARESARCVQMSLCQRRNPSSPPPFLFVSLTLWHLFLMAWEMKGEPHSVASTRVGRDIEDSRVVAVFPPPWNLIWMEIPCGYVEDRVQFQPKKLLHRKKNPVVGLWRCFWLGVGCKMHPCYWFLLFQHSRKIQQQDTQLIWIKGKTF